MNTGINIIDKGKKVRKFEAPNNIKREKTHTRFFFSNNTDM